MKIIALILSLLLLASCSNPDTSGGVTLSRGGDHGNEFPNGSCKGQAVKERSYGRSYCGWVSSVHKRVYIMPGAFLPGVNFTDVRLRNANLAGAYLTDLVLRGADWRDANLYRADLRSARLNDADLRDANLSRATLWGAKLIGAQLTSAYLNGAHLNFSDLTKARLDSADLRGADLSSANLLYADLRGADLTGVIANSRTRCPNGINWGTSGNNCPF